MQFRQDVSVKSSAFPHLGGNIRYGDAYTYYPKVLRYLVERFAIRSSLDVGAGQGHTAAYLNRLGVISYGMEGLAENIEQAIYPLIHHDLTTGPLRVPVDLVVCIECVEHISAEYIDSLMTTLTQGSIVVITHATPGQGGYHHVNEQPAEYWVEQFARYQFRHNGIESGFVRKLAAEEVCGPSNYMSRTGLVFQRY